MILFTDSDGMIVGLTSSLLCIFNIYIAYFHMAHNQAKWFNKNFILKFPKNMIKPPSLQKGSYKISSGHLSICLSVWLTDCDTFSSGSIEWIFLIFCLRIFCHICQKVAKTDFGKLYLFSRYLGKQHKFGQKVEYLTF